MGSTTEDVEHKSSYQPELDPEEVSVHNRETEENNDAPPVTAEDSPPPEVPEIYPALAAQYGNSIYPTVGTGWAAMARIVREVDDQKIQDYKEDIDTILVFAGLFSGVMTAFLVESYQGLTQDPTQVMILLMQQLASQTQSYSLNNGFVNSTAQPMQTIPVFTPSVNAIRVNVLWFASLTLSLVSASFSILVKQWLREYLSGEYTSPQARLRIRHFRNPGLGHWKVFEIAAVLPLLLQLSLGLFLIGLCFFTADIHETIGHTTLPLVAGWGFLFCAAAFAPALSPRCPYKMPLLKSVTKTMRKLIFRTILWAKDVSDRTTVSFTHIPTKWTYEILSYDEEDAVLTDNNDVDVLIAVDSIQSDEQLLSVMWDALQQTQLDPTDSVTFVLKIISHRLQRDVSAIPSNVFLDLKRLPKQTVTSIMSMVAEILRNEIIRQSPTNITKVIEWTPWMKDCIYILLSETSCPAPTAVNQVLSLLLADSLRYFTLFDIIHSRVPDSNTFPHVLERLRGALILIKGEDMLEAVTMLMRQYFCMEEATPHERLLDIVRDHPEIPAHHLQHLVDLLIFCLTNEMKPEMYWFQYLCDELELIIELSSKASWRDTIVKLVQTILIQSRNTAIYCRWALGMNEANRTLREDAQNLFIDAIMVSNPAERRTIMLNFRNSVDWQWREHPEEMDNQWDRGLRMDPLEVCELTLRLIKTLRERDSPLPEDYHFSQLWWTLDGALQTVVSRHIPSHPDTARRCLELINELDVSCPPDGQDEEAFAEWADNFPLNDTIFPDYWIERIAHFLPREETTFNHRIRRIRLTDKHGDNAHNDSSAASHKSSRRSSHSKRRPRSRSPSSQSGDDKPNANNDNDSVKDSLEIAVNGVSDNDHNDIIPPSPTNTANPDHQSICSPSTTPLPESPSLRNVY